MTFAGEFKDAFSELEPAERARLGRLGAVLFMAGSLTAIPAGLLLEPPPRLIDHVVSFVGFSLGFALIWLHWQRVSPAWLHFFPLAGTLIVIAGVAIFSVVFSFFLVLAAMFVAISVRDPRVFSAYMAFFTFALLLPLTYQTDDLSETAVPIVATLPVLLAVGLVSRYMHEVVERQKDRYRAFASQAIELGERIRGGPEPGGDDSPEALERRLKVLTEASSHERRNWSTRVPTGAPEDDVP